MPSLLVQSQDGSRRVYELSTTALTIGRAESCDVVLRNDGEVSREHARVRLDEDRRVLVTDMRSKNGTRVDDGEPFHNSTRPALQEIRIGEHVLLVLGAAEPARSPGTPAAETVVEFIPDDPAQQGTTRFFPSSRGLDLNRQRLSLLIKLAERIGRAFERKQLLEEALNACCDALNFERGLIVLKTARGDAEQPITRNVARDETGAYKVSRTLINRALNEGERAVVNNPATDLVGNMSESLVRFPICSALCVPILYRDEILGVIYGDRITAAATYSSADVDFLAAIAQVVGVGISNQKLFRDYLRLQTMEVELQAARRIQRELLPGAPLELGGVRIEGYNEPSSEIGGDYFDHFDLGDGRAAFVIADVTGHGLPAALMMANLQSAVRVAMRGKTPLADIVARINRLICENTASDVFITGVFGVIDARSGAIELVNAGHPAPVLVGSDLVLSERDNSLPLGIEPTETFRPQPLLPKQHRGVILLYTDGLVECEDRLGNQLGLERVDAALKRLPEFSAASAIRTSLDVVHEHLGAAKNRDDLTLLALQFQPE